ncbi:MAG: SAM-dependent methyltransferase [Betaproteobacteria bacterium]
MSSDARAQVPAPGRLYLVPMPLGDMSPEECLPVSTLRVVGSLRHFIAENARTARRFLTRVPLAAPIRELVIEELNEHTPTGAIPALLQAVLAGMDAGLVSEAGCPVVADPGAGLVALAHRRGVQVIPLIGPSAPLLALMASGLSGQSFRFAGYLPQEPTARDAALVQLDEDARRNRCAQIFIETPYRNATMLEAILLNCRRDTLLAVAIDLTLPTEEVITRPVRDWIASPRPSLHRRPAVFVIGA